MLRWKFCSCTVGCVVLLLQALPARGQAPDSPQPPAPAADQAPPATQSPPRTAAEVINLPQAPSRPPAPAPQAEPLAGYTNGNFFLRSPGNNFIFYPNGRLQVDGFFFPTPGDAPSGPPDGPAADSLADQRPRNTLFIRRLRAEINGTFFKHIDFNLGGEFATAPSGFQYGTFTDDFININYTPWANIQIGQFDAPFTLENRTSDKYFDFMERSLSVRALGVPTNKELGLMVWGLSPNRFLHYEAGVFNGDGQDVRNLDSHFDVMGRITFAPLAFLPAADSTRWLGDLWVGGSFWWGERVQVPYNIPALLTQANVTLMPSAFQIGPSAYNLGDDGQIIKWALEANLPVGPFGLRFEMTRIEREGVALYNGTDATRGTPLTHFNRRGTAFYVQAWYWIFGDYRILPTPGIEMPTRWQGYKPEKPWKMALFITAKYERMMVSMGDADGKMDPAWDAAKQAVLGDMSVDAGEVGLNLWLTRHVRFTTNYIMNYLDGSMPLIQGDIKLPISAAPAQSTTTFYQTLEHEVLFRAAIAL